MSAFVDGFRFWIKPYVPAALLSPRKIALPPLVVPVLGLILIGTLIFVLWYALWKLAFEPNPLVREFLDLDKTLSERKPKSNSTGADSHKSEGQSGRNMSKSHSESKKRR
jgi:hypothetical protein